MFSLLLSISDYVLSFTIDRICLLLWLKQTLIKIHSFSYQSKRLLARYEFSFTKRAFYRAYIHAKKSEPYHKVMNANNLSS